MTIDERMQKLIQDSFHDMPGHPPQVIPGLGDITGGKGVMRDLHNQAMDYADNAHKLKQFGINDLSSWWMALSFEAFVAMRVEYQPGKSILARSAAALALAAGAVDLLKMFVARGLEEGCPGDIAEELREIVEEAKTTWPEKFGEEST